MSGRKHKPVTVDPSRISGIVPEMAGPEEISGRSHPHGHPGMTGFRLLNCINGKTPDRVDAQFIQWSETRMSGGGCGSVRSFHEFARAARFGSVQV